MLWAYLDDSGVNDRKAGAISRFALGGGVATNSTWQELRNIWQMRLDDTGNPSKIEWFHYTEWKAAYLGHAKENKNQFFGWSKQRLLGLLSDLTRIIAKREVSYLCTSVRAQKHNRAVRKSYMDLTEKVINRAEEIANRANPSETQISFMFSRHAELAGINIQKYWNKLQILNQMPGRKCERADCVIGDPRKEPLLQVADLIVNEMASSRFIQVSWGPKFHLPEITNVMQQLRQQPPWHHMIEYHEGDEKGPDDR